jgi:hypothetical protein
VYMGMCSLVSKTWLPRSRHRLFRSLYLTPNSKGNPSRFLELLDSPLGTIAPYVHHLWLGGYKYKKTTGRLLNKTLRRLTVLTAVEFLSISLIQFERLDDVAITKFFSSFSGLKALQLNECSFLSSHQLSIVLSATERLERLGFYHVRLGSKSLGAFPARLRNLVSTTKGRDAIAPSLRLPNHLDDLKIVRGGDFVKEIVKCLEYADDISIVQKLVLHIDGGDHIAAYSKLMRMVGSSLRTLNILYVSSSSNPGMHPFSSHS